MSKNKKNKEFVELLSEQEICELHEAFNIFDVESDGSIAASQLMLLMKALKQKISEDELDNIFNEYNIDKNGQIYFNQFLKIMAKRLKNIQEDEDEDLKRSFSYLDRNKNGLISINEIRYMVLHSKKVDISESDIETIIREADTDGDGLISLEEFMTVMKN